MTRVLGHVEPTAPRERVEVELARVVDRLRSMSLARLAAPLPPYDSRADAAHDLAQRLADAAAALAGQPCRPLPRLGDQVVGDQVAVTGHDLLAAGDAAGAGTVDAALIAAALTAAADDLRALRLAL